MTILEELEQKLRKKSPKLELRQNEIMARHTSFRAGGPAALMALPGNRAEAVDALCAARELGISPFFLGNGSNLLVSDAGYPGFIIKTTGLESLSWSDVDENGPTLTADSGTALSRMANLAAERGLTGLEFAAGIPGTLGGAVMMNAGAYGGEMAQIVTHVTICDEKGEQITLPVAQCEMSYRCSIFTHHPHWFILGAQLRPHPGRPEEIRAKMADLACRRREKQPLELPSGGSTFKRPAPLPDGTPVYAAALIEQCGLKGFRVGGAQVSEKHAGFVVNTGAATCADILAVVEEVKRRVLEQTGVALELEIRTLGV